MSAARGHACSIIICLDYVLRTSIDKIKENGFELTKERSRRYLAKTITDADYADDIAIPANTPNQAERLRHCLERAAAGISLHVNAHKTEYTCFNQTWHFHTRRNLSETSWHAHLPRKQCLINRKNIDTWLTKAWTANVIWGIWRVVVCFLFCFLLFFSSLFPMILLF